jgi:hypothetical protein
VQTRGRVKTWAVVLAGLAGLRSVAETAIWVNAGSVASVVLSWNAPAANTDGTACTSLMEYRLYHRSDTNAPYPLGETGHYVQVGPSTNQAPLSLPVGLHWFVVTAVSADGAESAPSPELSLAIIAPHTNTVLRGANGVVLTVR